MEPEELETWAHIVCAQLSPREQAFVSPEAVKAVLRIVHRSTMMPMFEQLAEITRLYKDRMVE